MIVEVNDRQLNRQTIGCRIRRNIYNRQTRNISNRHFTYFILFGQVLVNTIWFLHKLKCKTVSSHLKFGFEDLKGQFQDLLPCIKDSIVRNGVVILVNTTGRLANVN